MNEYLFVYGTLMYGIPGEMARFLYKRAKYLGDVTAPGKLYDLGAYPGYVFAAQSDQLVKGQLFNIYDPATTLKELDQYEAIQQLPTDEYKRCLIPLIFEQREYNVWTYIYSKPIDELRQIADGDYMNYYKTQLNHQRFIGINDI